MIRAAAVVPHPPLLLPGVGGRSDPLADLRARSLEAVGVLGAGPVVVLESGPPGGYDVAAWLCRAAGIEPQKMLALDADRDVDVAPGTALLVLADGSAARGPLAPAGPHPDAEASDDALAALLAAGDAAGLAAYRPAPVLLADGAPALRALGRLAAGRRWHGRLLAHEAPFGVAYLVAAWTPL
ncbi:MAG TPA: hypothetical protein VF288_06290 [Mycobacteriales bacterium]